MDTLTIILLILLGATALVGGIMAFVASRRAPHGFEDEYGFHHTDHKRKKESK